MKTGLLAALPWWAAEGSSGLRHFEIADGFALTLIAILMLVLAGVVAVARAFCKRERHPPPEAEAMQDAEATDPRGQPAQDSEHPWEREADWWKRNPRD